ncbi:MAG TPA: septation protein SepH [Pseudonocardiaceae bacterium]|nr:septation protein SepH [Pseudonocardiaceae bacterium]
MRALRVVGLSEDGKSVICEDVARSERFTVPADERLRAAARGDVTRLGQIEIELESLMRPREIQARIRAGESVDQVAAAAGVPAHRVERFAYPVLLERSRTAELAQRAHPVREDGPDVQTLAEVAAHAFGLRGQDYAAALWDSWRGEDGKWVVQLLWNTGRSDNRAHWAFHPGAHGGTVIPLDEHAHDLMDPNAANRPLRTVRPVTELARQALEAQPLVRGDADYDDYDDYREPPVREPAAREPVVREPVVREPVVREPVMREAVREREPVREPVREREPVHREPEPEPVREREPVRREPVRHEPVVPEPVVRRPEPEPRPEPQVEPEPQVADRVEDRVEDVAPVDPPVEAPTDTAPAAEPVAEPEAVEAVEPEPEPEPTPEPEPAPEPAAKTTKTPPAPQRKTEPNTKRGKKNHPIVPSWEDVLLGVRTQRG